MNYGIPYMGSKNSILKKLCAIFPNAENFYDLFGGGFSVSHFMIENRSKDFNEFHFNEIRKGIPELIKDAINGKYNYDVYKPEFITREMFFKKKDIDPMVKIVWSFGNNGKAYLFGKDIEKQKESMHNAIIFNKFDNYAMEVFGIDKFKEGYQIKDKRLYLRNKIKFHKNNNNGIFKNGQQLEQLQQLQQLERLEQLQQLQQLERLERKLIFTNVDYRDIKIKENSVIYCDPPYIGTNMYDGEFNHKEFYKWIEKQKTPLFISEYTKPKCDGLFLISRIKKRSMFDPKKRLVKMEQVFGNKAALDAVKKRLDYGKTRHRLSKRY